MLSVLSGHRPASYPSPPRTSAYTANGGAQ